MRVLQISDVHLGVTTVLGRDAHECLAAVVSDVQQRNLVPDVIVATGDLVHDAQASYADLQAALAPP